MKITPNNVTPEIARIHAHVCGDGFIYLSKEHRSPGSLKKDSRRNLDFYMWILGYSNTCPVLIEEFKRDLKKAFNRKGLYCPRHYEIRIRGAKHLIKKLELEESNSFNWFIPSFIINSSYKIISNWLRVFFDDEGTIDVQKKRIRAKSVNKRGLLQVKMLLSKLNIYSIITGPNIDNTWYLNIYRDFLENYQKKLGFLHPKKKGKLKELMGRVGV